MRIQGRNNGSAVAVLDLEGRLTAGADAACLGDAVDALLKQKRVNVVLNMRRVHLVDCAGIGRILNCHSKTRRRGGCLKLVHADERLRRLLELLCLKPVLEIFESEQTAVASLMASQSGAPAWRLVPFRPGADQRSVLIPITRPQPAT